MIKKLMSVLLAIFLSFGIFTAPSYAVDSAAKIYYVSSTGLDSNNGLTVEKAFKTLAKAANTVKNPGDTVLVLDGTYRNEVDPNKHILLISGKSGTSSQPIVFKNYPGHKPTIKSKAAYAVIITNSSYVNFEGFNLIGAVDDITLEYAKEQRLNTGNPSTANMGIAITTTYKDGVAPTPTHHIIIKGNEVSKFGGGAIGTQYVDWVTVEKNIVHDSTFYNSVGNSGISFLNNLNFDDNVTDYKIIIKDNVVYNNRNLVTRAANDKITEGHGIIIDTQKDDTKVPAYKGRTLIAGNIVFNNGGAGIEVFKSGAPVDVINNTTHQNVQSPELQASIGEIDSILSDNVTAFNNIIYARKDGIVNNTYKATNALYDNNIVFNSSRYKLTGTSNIFADPQLNADFTLKRTSPAIDKGKLSLNGIKTPEKDIYDGDGDKSALPDIGAVEAKC